MARKPTLFCQVEPEFKARFDVRLAHERTTMQAVILELADTYLKSEQRASCALCGSITYAACTHVQIQGIGDSVPKTEQLLSIDGENRSIEPLPAEAVEIAKAWVVAQRVQGVRWRSMLQSIQHQLQLVRDEAYEQFQQPHNTEPQPAGHQAS